MRIQYASVHLVQWPVLATEWGYCKAVAWRWHECYTLLSKAESPHSELGLLGLHCCRLTFWEENFVAKFSKYFCPVLSIISVYLSVSLFSTDFISTRLVAITWNTWYQNVNWCKHLSYVSYVRPELTCIKIEEKYTAITIKMCYISFSQR